MHLAGLMNRREPEPPLRTLHKAVTEFNTALPRTFTGLNATSTLDLEVKEKRSNSTRNPDSSISAL